MQYKTIQKRIIFWCSINVFIILKFLSHAYICKSSNGTFINKLITVIFIRIKFSIIIDITETLIPTARL